MNHYDFDTMHPRDAYRLLIEAVVPRPIAFVSTCDAAGVVNLAPFSFFNAVCSAPPTLVFSVTPKSDGSPKDTLRNIEATGQFVVNCASEWLLPQLNQCSAEYPHGVSEFTEVGLTPEPSLKVRPPRVKEAALQMECSLSQLVPVGQGPGSATLVLGRILSMHVSPKVTDGQGRIDPVQLAPMARLGGTAYMKLGPLIHLPRPKITQ